MDNLDFPSLEPSDIEIRVATTKETFVDLLLYKDARVDMRMLDKVVGPMDWKREHQTLDGVNYCTVSIFDHAKKEWVSKQDCGVGGDFEAVKGSSSDAFKRACFNWGIGRELYTVPQIRVWGKDGAIHIKENKGKFVCYDKFAITNLVIEDHVVTALEIVNEDTGQTVYRMGSTHVPVTGHVDVRKNKAVLKLKETIKRVADATGQDADELIKGVKKRTDYVETAEFYERVEEEFESQL